MKGRRVTTFVCFVLPVSLIPRNFVLESSLTLRFEDDRYKNGGFCFLEIKYCAQDDIC